MGPSVLWDISDADTGAADAPGGSALPRIMCDATRGNGNAETSEECWPCMALQHGSALGGGIAFGHAGHGDLHGARRSTWIKCVRAARSCSSEHAADAPCSFSAVRHMLRQGQTEIDDLGSPLS